MKKPVLVEYSKQADWIIRSFVEERNCLNGGRNIPNDIWTYNTDYRKGLLAALRDEPYVSRAWIGTIP